MKAQAAFQHSIGHEMEPAISISSPEDGRVWYLNVYNYRTGNQSLSEFFETEDLSYFLFCLFDSLLTIDHVILKTASGDILVTREFADKRNEEIDNSIRTLLTLYGLEGIAFPAAHGRAAHIATLEDPYWCHLGKKITDVEQQYESGKISKRDAIERIVSLMS